METLKEFSIVLIDHTILVYTRHNNLTHKFTYHDFDHVIPQRLIIQEYGAELKYIKRENNEVSDALSGIYYNHVKVRMDFY